jgi:hypothetical protein
MKHCVFLPAGLAALLLCVTSTDAHSWVQQLLLIASNGTFVGTPGYPRGFVQRTSPAFSDFESENLVPPDGRPTGTEILPTDLMCKSTQSIGNQTAGNPALVAAPGDNVALVYEENGHVTLLDRSPTKPVGSGTIFIYGTKEPQNNDTYLGIHRVWNANGTGGDQRGKLLATRNFDDGQCYQNNTSELAIYRRDTLGTVGNDLNCQSDVQLPEDAGTNGTYTLYWLWEWPTLNNVTGAEITNESYTTCMDIVMTSNQLADAGSFNSTQLVDYRAIETELSTAFIVNPTASEQLTTTPGVPASPTTTVSSAPVQTSSNAAGDFVTVTVTASPVETETITVTTIDTVVNTTPNTQQAQPSTTQTQPSTIATVTSTTTTAIAAAAIPASGQTTTEATSSSTQTAALATSSESAPLPAVQPFLNPNSAVISGSIATSSPTDTNAAASAQVTTLTSSTETSTTTSTATCTSTAGSKRRRRNRQRRAT